MRSGKSHFETLKHDEWNKPPKQVWTSIEFYTIYIFCFFSTEMGKAFGTAPGSCSREYRVWPSDGRSCICDCDDVNKDTLT